MKREEHAREFLDGPVPSSERAASLRDIAWLNARFAGYRLTRHGVRALAGARATLRVLDVGGGGGDFARHLLGWARRRGQPLRVVVVDAAPDALALARAAAADRDVLLVRAEAGALPFRAGAVDVAVAVLLLHHLDPDRATAALREMATVARDGLVVNDLLRTPLSLALVWLATRVFRCHRFSRHDGPLSVRRSYGPDELQRLAARAGLRRLGIRRYPLFGRLLALGRPGGERATAASPLPTHAP
jgi:ubiquinone/menaquinone biosynthesis C-methylase UbiE